MADLGHARLALDAAAGLMLTRIETGKGYCLPRIGKALRVHAKGQQQGNGVLAHTRNTVKQFPLVLQAGIAINMVADLLAQRLDLVIQPLDMTDDIVTDDRACDLQPVAFLRAHGLQGVQTQHQGTQGLLTERGCLPRLRPAFATKFGNQLRIDFVSLGAHQARGAEGLDLRRVDHADRQSLVRQEFGHGFPVHASRFHADVGAVRTLLVKPFGQRRKTALTVFKNLVSVLAVGQAQRAIQLGFSNINSQMKRLHTTSSSDLPCECGLPASRAKDTVRSLTEGERLLQGSTLLAQGQRVGTASSRSFLRCPSGTATVKPIVINHAIELTKKHNTRVRPALRIAW